MSNDELAEDAKRRIEERLKQRREDLERRVPGITEFAGQLKEVFGPVRVVDKLDGVSVFPLLVGNVRSHMRCGKTKKRS